MLPGCFHEEYQMALPFWVKFALVLHFWIWYCEYDSFGYE